MGFAWIGTGLLFTTSDNTGYVTFSEEGKYHHHLTSPCSGRVAWRGKSLTFMRMAGIHPQSFTNTNHQRLGQEIWVASVSRVPREHFMWHGAAVRWERTCREGFWGGLTEKPSACVMASSGHIWGEVVAKERRRQSRKAQYYISVFSKQRIWIFLFWSKAFLKKTTPQPSQSLI